MVNSKKRKAVDDHTIMDVISGIMPGRKLEQWFSWPPDVFLMTSYLLKKTGAYRNVVNDPEWAFEEIQKLDLIAHEWLTSIQRTLISGGDSRLKLPAQLSAMVKDLEILATAVTFTELRSAEMRHPTSAATTDDAKPDDPKTLSFLLLKLHALADSCSASFGILGDKTAGVAIVHYLANLLLITRGSLSTVPKFQGIVIPKMRTPQSGLTIRSFSLHLTYHDTEVEIMWRALPWMNVDQNNINMLCVPWPTEVASAEFSCKDETFEHVRYFGYNKDIDSTAKIHGLIEQLVDLNRKRGKIHIIVFPEIALSESEYDYLLALLKKEYEEHNLPFMPMVLAGVRKIGGSAGALDLNYVKLAAFFVGKWYDLSQTKHHRWKLDRNQLMQYELSSRFSTERNWFEKIEIRQRRLSFFVPNGWLALCPLICEDLAQLEPVSEIIRGVGPTMLVALLMDGPQIKERWPARYASVFADDPGTAVLTLTSIGMIQKSCQLKGSVEMNTEGIGLWKDQIHGWQNIKVKDADATALITVSASFREEHSADGRSDGGAAAIFKLDNVFYAGKITVETTDVNKKIPRHETIGQSSIWRGEWRDLQELTSLTFAIDALLSSFGAHWPLIKTWIIKSEQSPGLYYSYITNLLSTSYDDPLSVGIWPGEENSRKDSLAIAVNHMETWVEVILRAGQVSGDRSDYYGRIIDDIESRLKDMQQEESKLHSMSRDMQDEYRIKKAIPIAILILMHNRLDEYRLEKEKVSFYKMASCFKRIEKVIADYEKFKAA